MVHVGGVAHYLAPTGWVVDEQGNNGEPDWSQWDGDKVRYQSARFCAGVLRALVAGEAAPEVPEGLASGLTERLSTLRRELVELVERYRDEIER